MTVRFGSRVYGKVSGRVYSRFLFLYIGGTAVIDRVPFLQLK